jgi:hypothetical protein
MRITRAKFHYYAVLNYSLLCRESDPNLSIAEELISIRNGL